VVDECDKAGSEGVGRAIRLQALKKRVGGARQMR
jgi:hypothetical protein